MKALSPLRLLCALPVAVIGLSVPAHAASLGNDNASNYTTATWVNGSNGGTGFSPWGLPTDSFFNPNISSSSGNGGSPNIDSSGVAFRIQRTGGFNQVTRDFGVGGLSGTSALDPGQSFKVSFDFTNLTSGDAGQAVGFWMTTPGGGDANGERWGFQYVGGSNTLGLKVNGGSLQDSGIPAFNLNNGVNLTFNLLAGGAWNATFELTGDVAGTYVLDSDTFGTLGAAPTGFRFFVAGNTGTKNQYINNLAVVPEPSTVLLLGAAGLALTLFRRRRAVRE